MDIIQTRKTMQKSALGRLFLGILSLFYGTIVLLRRWFYALGIIPSKRLSARTICIGNLTTGGTGKTSAVLLAAHTLHKHNMKTAILSRGYLRPTPMREIQVLLNTQNVSWHNTGDEPWMMHHALHGMDIPILVSPNRYRAGQEALNYYDTKILLLDDGFQHFRLKRDLDILLINATDPFGGGRLLPLGNLREPMSAIRRAGLVILTHADKVDSERLAEIQEIIRKINKDVPILEAAHRPDFVLNLKTEEKLKPSHLRGKQIAIFSGLGDPDSFEAQLKQLGAEITQRWRYPDHHRYSEADLQSMENVRRDMPLVTTLKDAVRMPSRWQNILRGEVLILGIKMEITKGEKIWEQELCKQPFILR